MKTQNGQPNAVGRYIDVSRSAREAGILVPVFLSEEAYRRYIQVPKGCAWQSEYLRLWDLLWVCRLAWFGRKDPAVPRSSIFFNLVTNDGMGIVTTTLASISLMSALGTEAFIVLTAEEAVRK